MRYQTTVSPQYGMRFFVVTLLSFIGQAHALKQAQDPADIKAQLLKQVNADPLPSPANRRVTTLSSLDAVNCMPTLFAFRDEEHVREKRVRQTWINANENQDGPTSEEESTESCQRELADSGYIKEIASAMERAPMDARIQSTACANLNFLMAGLEHGPYERRCFMVNDRILDTAVQAVRNFPSMPDGDQYTVYEDCLEVLATLDEHLRQTGNTAFLELHAKKDIEKALEVRGDSPRVKEAANKLLKGFTTAGQFKIRALNAGTEFRRRFLHDTMKEMGLDYESVDEQDQWQPFREDLSDTEPLKLRIAGHTFR